MVARLLWEQDAASSSLATWTKKQERHYAFPAFCIVERLENKIQGSGGALFAAGLDGGNTSIFISPLEMKMQTSLAAWTILKRKYGYDTCVPFLFIKIRLAQGFSALFQVRFVSLYQN